MTSISLALPFIFGLLIGSFLNVVGLRYNTGMSLGGRSKCFSCSKELTWSELIPVMSFLFQRGKCRKCKSKISWQYPVIELLSGVLFVLLFITFPPTDLFSAFTLLTYFIITGLLVVITLYDIKHKIIPDGLVYTFAAIALLRLFVGSDFSFQIPSTLDLLAGPILALPFALIWYFSKGKWMGLGDAKLILGIGWLLGLVPGISALALSFWIAAPVSLVWMYVVLRKFKSHYEIPFGPYLIVGMYLVLIFGIDVISFT